MSERKTTNQKLGLEEIKLVIGFAAFVIGIILLIFTLVLTVIAPFALPVTAITGIIGLVSALGGGVLGGVTLKNYLTNGESNQR